jgi:hypothetical protein
MPLYSSHSQAEKALPDCQSCSPNTVSLGINPPEQGDQDDHQLRKHPPLNHTDKSRTMATHHIRHLLGDNIKPIITQGLRKALPASCFMHSQETFGRPCLRTSSKTTPTTQPSCHMQASFDQATTNCQLHCTGCIRCVLPAEVQPPALAAYR